MWLNFESQCIRLFNTKMNFKEPKLVEHNTFRMHQPHTYKDRHLTLIDEMCALNLCNISLLPKVCEAKLRSSWMNARMNVCASEWMGGLDDKWLVAWMPACASSRLLVVTTLRCVWSGLPLCTHNVTYPTIPTPCKTKFLLLISSCTLCEAVTRLILVGADLLQRTPEAPSRVL